MDDNSVQVNIDASTPVLILCPGDGTTWPLTDQMPTVDADHLADYLGPLQRQVFAARMRGWADRLDRDRA